MSGNEKILDRVRKMLRLAENAGATEGERDNALRMAHATLAKYNLDLTAIGDVDHKPGEKPDEPRVCQDHTFIGWPWARNICSSIAKLFFCDYLYTGNGSTKTLHHFIGRTSNATTAALVAEFVVRAVSKEAWKYAADNFGGSPLARSFGWGAAGKIRERVLELQAKSTTTNDRKAELPVVAAALAEDNRQALVLRSVYETEKVANQQFIQQKFGKLGREHGGHSSVSGLAITAGRAYGARVSLNVQIK